MDFVKLILILVFSPSIAICQIKIDEPPLPGLNDTLWTSTDYITKVNLERSGSDRYWNFSNLSSATSKKQLLKKTDPFLISSDIDYDFFISSAPEVFHLIKTTREGLREVAVQKPHPFNPSVVTLSEYNLSRLIRNKAITYGAQNNTNAIIYFALANRDIPERIKQKVPVYMDSLRVVEISDRNSEIDASGTLMLPEMKFQVLREHIIEEKQNYVEVFTAGQWFPIDNELLDPDGELLGTMIYEQYNFFAEEEKFPVSTVVLNGMGNIEKVEYKAPTSSRKFVNLPSNRPEYLLSPNPSYGDVKLELLNLETGDYQFEIFNVIGKKLWSEKIKIEKDFESYAFDLSFLGKGTYLWSFTDKNNIRKVTKRLVIITP